MTGRTEFIDNMVMPGMLHCAILRSPHAHARIVSIDTSAAEALPGVVAVLTRDDVLRWANPMTTIPEGWAGHCLATERVRFVGEPVVAVAAKSRYVAEDALELITVEYETLEANTDARKAADGSAPLLFEEKGTNTIFERVFTWGEVDAAFAAADRVVTESYRWHRLGANPLETFGCISQWDPIENALTCWGLSLIHI